MKKKGAPEKDRKRAREGSSQTDEEDASDAKSSSKQ